MQDTAVYHIEREKPVWFTRRNYIMKRKTSFGIALGTALLSAALLAGCGSAGTDSASSNSYKATKAVYESPASALYEEAAEESFATADYAAGSGQAETVTESGAATNRKLITTIHINAETEDFDKSRSLVENKINELGGYIENSSIYNEEKSANYTIRIPADKADSLITALEGNNNITSKSVNVEDVTLSYADTESRKKALKTEEERLLKIMESAETVEDLITVESRLSEVRYELESIESQLRTYDNKIDYTTVYLYLEEVERYTPVEKETAGQRISKGFVDSLESIGNGFVEFFIWFVVHIPQLIVAAIFVGIIVLIVKAIEKSSKKKKAAYYAQQAAYMNNQATPVQQQTQQNNDSAEGKNE